MSKIDGYSVYQNLYYENTVNKKKSKAMETDEKKEAVSKLENPIQAEQTSSVKLSDNAKSLLEELKQKYTNMDFMVADYNSDEEAQNILARGTKQYSVLIDPDTLEQMAADQEIKEKYVAIIDGATEKIQGIKDELGEDGKEVTRIGFTVGQDGAVKYFAELEKMSDQQMARIEEAREEKKAQQKEVEEKEKEKQEEEKKTEKDKKERPAVQEAAKRITVQASTVEELIEKIKNVDWNKVQTQEANAAGVRFDLAI